MSVSFVRIDDRMIHGQTVTRWAKELPCDGIIAVNDLAASNPVLKQAYISAAESQGKKGFVWTLDHFRSVASKVLASSTRYFLIIKTPQDMKQLLVDFKFVPSDVKQIVVGPGNDRPGTIKLGNNQSFTPEEGACFEALTQAGYTVKFQLLPDVEIGTWDKFRDKFNL